MTADHRVVLRNYECHFDWVSAAATCRALRGEIGWMFVDGWPGVSNTVESFFFFFFCMKKDFVAISRCLLTYVEINFTQNWYICHQN